MTTYQFSDPVERELGDETPIIFEWKRSGVNPAVQIAMDNINFSDINGTVTDITNTGGVPRYRIEWHVDDNPTSASIVTYKIAEGGDTAYLEVRYTKPVTATEPTTPEVPADGTLSELVTLLGPRRVKTKDMEIERDSIDKMQKLLERRSKKPVSLGQMRHDIVVPKYGDYCDKYRRCN